jgi:hypothetical protein
MIALPLLRQTTATTLAGIQAAATQKSTASSKGGHGKNEYTFLPFPCQLTIPTRRSPSFTMHPYGDRLYVPVRFLARIGPKGEEMNLHAIERQRGGGRPRIDSY